MCDSHLWYTQVSYTSRVQQSDWCVVCGALHPGHDPRMVDNLPPVVERIIDSATPPASPAHCTPPGEDE